MFSDCNEIILGINNNKISRTASCLEIKQYFELDNENTVCQNLWNVLEQWLEINL